MAMFQLQVQELRVAQADGSHVLPVRWFTSIKDIKDMLHKLLGVQPRFQDLFYGTSKLSNHLTLHDLGIEKSGRVLRLVTSTGVVGGSRSHSENGFLLVPTTGGPVSTTTGMKPNSSSYSSLSSLPSSGTGGFQIDESCEELLEEVIQGFKKGRKPISTDALDCTGGVYFLVDGENRKCAVFKPFDEEQGMHNNNKGYDGTGETGLRPNFKPGQGCIRELAAYLLDKDHFSGVPETVLVHCEHKAFSYPLDERGRKTAPFPKLGSLQRFIYFQHTWDDIGSSCFSDFEVQKIALLDLRLLNCDRNASNILVLDRDANYLPDNRLHRYGHRYDRSSSICSSEDWRGSEFFEFSEEERETFNSDSDLDRPRSRRNTRAGSDLSKSRAGRDQYILVPIDHGYTLPTSLQINEYDLVWFNMPQLRRPVDPEIKEYMLSLDFDDLIEGLASQVAVSSESIFLLRLAHNLIVNGIKAGLTLYDIAKLIARVDEDEKSPLERTIATAEENAHRAMEMRSGRLDSRSIPFPATLTHSHSHGSMRRLAASGVPSHAQLASQAQAQSTSRSRAPLSSSSSSSASLSSRGTSLLRSSSGDAEWGLGGEITVALDDAALCGRRLDGDGDTSGADSHEGSIKSDKENNDEDGDGDADIEGSAAATMKAEAATELDGGSDYSMHSNPNSPANSSSFSSNLKEHGDPLGFLSPLAGKALKSLKSVDNYVNSASMHGSGVYMPGHGQTRPAPQRPQTAPSPSSAAVTPSRSSGPRATGLQTPPSSAAASANKPPSGPSPRSSSSSRGGGGLRAELPASADGLAADGASLSPRRVLSEELDGLVARVGQGQGHEGGEADELKKKGLLGLGLGPPPLPPTSRSSSGRQSRRKTAKREPGGTTVDPRPGSPSRYDADAEVESPDEAGDAGRGGVHGDFTDSSEDEDLTWAEGGAGKDAPPSATVSQQLPPALKAAPKQSSLKTSAIPLMRVTSFSSFSSDPIYDVEQSERRLMKLNREKRRANASKPEFQVLRRDFAEQRLAILLGMASTHRSASRDQIK